MKYIIPLLAVLTLSACAPVEFHDARSQTDKKYARAEAKCNFEVSKMSGQMDRSPGLVGAAFDRSYLERHFRTCMAAEGYQVKK